MATFIGTTKPLGAGQTWSQTFNAERSDSVGGSIFSSEGGELQIFQSGDNINWDLQMVDEAGDPAPVAVFPNTGIRFSENILLPHVKIVFTPNGGAAVATLRIFARLNSAGVDL